MPKYIVKNEQILNEFMSKFWRFLGNRKGRDVVKLFANDPIMKKHIKDAEKIADKIRKRISAEDEEFWKDYKKRHGHNIYDD